MRPVALSHVPVVRALHDPTSVPNARGTRAIGLWHVTKSNVELALTGASCVSRCHVIIHACVQMHACARTIMVQRTNAKLIITLLQIETFY